ncbi:MAG TPA: hypothetical protein PLL78_11680 [Fimbriimonadaceae bacterium]|nr:hypothetical protein [Fimbriimonadaceae bacterium]HRJ97334.1 hypothetical protein [Fimbriimonadaceae bacterium]
MVIFGRRDRLARGDRCDRPISRLLFAGGFSYAGWFMAFAALFCTVTILLRWDLIYGAVKFIVALGSIRGFLVLMAARYEGQAFWMVAGAGLIALSAILAYIVHFHDD